MVESIKKAALDAVAESMPTALLFGTVKSEKPLKIFVEQKLTLEEKQLVLARGVTEYEIDMTVDHKTEKALDTIDLTHTHPLELNTEKSGDDLHTHPLKGETQGGGKKDLTHLHDYKGRKTFLVHSALLVGEKVILIRLPGGQRYLVLDRVVV